jgi:tRNA (guanine-N7-)-methyltransferase
MPQRILNASQMKWPADWPAIFDRNAPLIMELGFGNGRFLVDLAAKKPESNVIGVEISWRSIKRCLRHIDRNHQENARVIYGSGLLALWALFKPKTIEKLYINFPDPWPKKAHHHRRLINRRFLNLLASRMPGGASLDIATDHEEYATWISENLIQNRYFDSRVPTTVVNEVPERFQTKYERKARASHRDCYYFLWQRNGQDTSEDFPDPKEYNMPHANLQIPLGIDTIFRELRPTQEQAGGIVVRFSNLFLSDRGNVILVDTYISELPLEQHVMIAIKERRKGNFLVYIYETGHPRSTEGVHFALQSLTRQLGALHPESALLRHNLYGFQLE